MNIEKQQIIDYFDRCAPFWDGDMIKDEEIVNLILEGADVRAGKTVLDVATGTGVLIPNYLERGVASVTAVDFSDEMIKIAKSKFHEDNVKLICCDVFDLDTPEAYDCIVVYNAFPHFPQPEALIAHLAKLLKVGGTLTIAHGMSREKLCAHHSGSAKQVSIELLHEDVLADMLSERLSVSVKISNDRMYQISARKMR